MAVSSLLLTKTQTVLIFASLVLAGLACYVLLQTVLTLNFVRALAKAKPQIEPDYTPRVCVFLSLRGADPGLEAGIERLLDQDYPNYQLRVVVDSEADPAWDLMKRAADRRDDDRLQVDAIRERRTTCGLKCTAMAQLADDLPDDCEVIVLADADMVPHRGWLRELTAPLADEEVGLATGNQWFSPERAWWGSLIRAVWNAGAIVNTFLWANPWAGSCAIRRSVFDAAGLADKWKTTAVDDGPIQGALKPLNVQMRFVPTLVMINREDCTLSFSLTWIARMLTWSRLYEPTFAITLYHALSTTALILCGIIGGGFAAAFDQWVAAAMLWGSVLTFIGSMAISLLWIDSAVRRVARLRGEEHPALPVIAYAKMICAVPLTQFIYAIAAVVAFLRRRIQWRGVTYELNGPYDVRLVDDQPFQVDEDAPSNVSL